MDKRHWIAQRVAKELKNGDVVNLGIGLPSLVGNYVASNVELIIQSENGLLGLDGMANEDQADPDLVNAGGQAITAVEGACYFDSAMSFTIIRGGHVDVSILGALEVDQDANLANWLVPGKLAPGMGGAMDLVVGARTVIIAMEHTNKGKPKLLKRCSLPLTATGQVNLVVTEFGVFKPNTRGFEVLELAPNVSLEMAQAASQATLYVSA
ncbi:3-oxoacid CoA-transferase subunit B [Alginatibacterium sediminis]|uniref:3-oxoacid CoA-transferase subunit B n=1 Tax=Alginatibacterium sediminis TaxID=2164068 RepID=UPI0018F32EB5|nr:3-oxoacid CoA-transferase subunit B [Alginatibacterium sediminis]